MGKRYIYAIGGDLTGYFVIATSEPNTSERVRRMSAADVKSKQECSQALADCGVTNSRQWQHHANDCESVLTAWKRGLRNWESMGTGTRIAMQDKAWANIEAEIAAGK